MRRLQTDRTVVALAFSPDGRRLAAGGFLRPPQLSLWDLDL